MSKFRSSFKSKNTQRINIEQGPWGLSRMREKTSQYLKKQTIRTKYAQNGKQQAKWDVHHQFDKLANDNERKLAEERIALT